MVIGMGMGYQISVRLRIFCRNPCRINKKRTQIPFFTSELYSQMGLETSTGVFLPIRHHTHPDQTLHLLYLRTGKDYNLFTISEKRR
jgi:hypothetical protein